MGVKAIGTIKSVYTHVSGRMIASYKVLLTTVVVLMALKRFPNPASYIAMAGVCFYRHALRRKTVYYS